MRLRHLAPLLLLIFGRCSSGKLEPGTIADLRWSQEFRERLKSEAPKDFVIDDSVVSFDVIEPQGRTTTLNLPAGTRVRIVDYIPPPSNMKDGAYQVYVLEGEQKDKTGKVLEHFVRRVD